MAYSTLTLIKRILLQARPYWAYILGIFVLNLLATPIVLLKPLALKILIDSAFGAHPLPEFIRFFFPPDFAFSFETVIFLAAALVIFTALIDNIYVLIIWILNTYTGEKLVLDFRTLLFNHIQRLSLAYHDSNGISDSVYRIQYDTMAIRTFLIGNLSPLISAFITLLGMFLVMFLIKWQLALLAMGVVPPLIFISRFSTVRLRRDWKKVKEYESTTMAVVHEVLSSLRVVKAFGQEEEEGARFIRQADKAVKGQLQVAWVGALFYFLVGMVFATGTAGFMYFGAGYVAAKHMTLGELTLVIAYLAQIFGPLEKISKNINDIQSSLTSIERVFLLLDKEMEVKERAHPVPLAKASGAIEYKQVYFSYEKGNQNLEDISFVIQPGDRVGIMGSTGAGKSTLISLLTRFYDPLAGQILVDGVDIKNYKLSDYRKQFSIVLQDPVLFSTTVAENIRYGLPGASTREIIAAAQLANAHDFITRSPQGYDTLVGERGLQLSGGERQRIALARAFIKNAPILIMDEPTSSLDVHTEAQIMEAMERLMAGRTSFLITHRLDTLYTCNIIIHLEKGRLVDFIPNKNPELLAHKKKTFRENP